MSVKFDLDFNGTSNIPFLFVAVFVLSTDPK